MTASVASQAAYVALTDPNAALKLKASSHTAYVVLTDPNASLRGAQIASQTAYIALIPAPASGRRRQTVMVN